MYIAYVYIYIYGMYAEYEHQWLAPSCSHHDAMLKGASPRKESKDMETYGGFHKWGIMMVNICLIYGEYMVNTGFWVSIVMGVAQKWMVYFMSNPLQMDDDWGYPHFRKPPYGYINTL